ncbi:MAG: hypothetical protein AB7T48_06190 [Solirubrobacterales bacterium]
MNDYRPTHEALAYRRGDGFLAMCTCGWIGRERLDRRAATRDAREHEERAPIREARRLAQSAEQE